MAVFELREYQQDALDALRHYLRKVPNMGARTAFMDVANMLYSPAPFVDDETPYACIRIPTGGGKTIVAAHAVGVASQEYMQADNPMVLWLVPSNAILDQTLAALKDLDHPYRMALAADFGRNITVLTVAEALSLSRPDATGGACIIVSTIQAFRVDDTTGRKVYDDAGALMDHFSGLAASQTARLDLVEGTPRPKASLANVLKLHRPMIIVDEAHNSRTDLSFETLARFDPSLILELTATPQTKKNAEKGLFPSNVLYHVSAAELKAAQMIKLPIRLETEADWKKIIGQALDCQNELEKIADSYKVETGEYIRPIILFQAQSASKNDPDRLTPERVVEYLSADKRIPRNQIAIHAKSFKELDDIKDIEAEDCGIRYVVTISKLREGWDCPFAYILCSVAEMSSGTAVEQILGRVLRMPKAKRKSRDELNRAYAFVASNNFQMVAKSLKDGLVEGAGFDRLEADELVKSHNGFNFAEDQPDFEHESDVLPESESADVASINTAIEKLPPSLKGRISFEPKERRVKVVGTLAKVDRNSLLLAFAGVEGAGTIIDKLYNKSNRIQASEQAEGVKPPFIVPRLGIMRQGVLELFGQDHFLDLPWNLATCDPTEFVTKFKIRDTSETGEIDVTDDGKMTIAFVDAIHDQLAMAIHEPAWTLPRLVNWIDRGIKHPDVTKPAAKLFIQGALDNVMAAKGYSLDELARYKYEVRREIANTIDTLRKEREATTYGALFASSTDNFKTSADMALLFDEQNYAYNQPYRGSQKFKKHYFSIIGDLKNDGEEFRCAVHLDNHPRVKYWLRNVDRKPNSFWLQLPSNKFYPDFMAMLDDGRILAVEYKGAHLMSESKDKLAIGNLWADASNGQCLFVMPTDRDFDAIDRVIAQDL